MTQVGDMGRHDVVQNISEGLSTDGKPAAAVLREQVESQTISIPDPPATVVENKVPRRPAPSSDVRGA